MRKLSIIGTVALLAACAYAAPKAILLTAENGTNATATVSTVAVAGYIDEIVAYGPAVSTGTFAVVAAQPLANTVTLAGKSAITALTRTRPRFDGTIADGTANTNDPPERYLSWGDTITVTWSSAEPTGGVWRVWIKYDDGK